MEETFCNPVPFSDGKKHTNPDPFILRWCGRYYCYATDEAGVKVSVSDDMVHWNCCGYAIKEKEYRNYWAPSVLYRDGVFYMYYSNISAEETDCHEEHLKLAVSKNPLGPFLYRKTFFDKFSIDSHPVVRGGELYMFYSVNDWIGLESRVAGTCILVDKMLSPEEFAGEPRAVVLPSLEQEIYAENRFGDGRDWYTIEGACPVFHGEKCWMLYSANAFENIHYFVGTAVAEMKKSLLEMEWKKYPTPYTWMPLLKRNQAVEGTGHNTVAKAPNLFDDWIIYHGRDVEEGLDQGKEQRSMRIDPLFYFGNRIFCPGPSYKKRPIPGKSFYSERDRTIDKEIFFTEAADFYRMEIWCSSVLSHAGAKYMLYLNYVDGENYVGLIVHSGMGKIRAVCCKKGIAVNLAEMKLSKGYHADVPHLISIERKQNGYSVMLDEDAGMDFQSAAFQKVGRIGAVSYFTQVILHSVIVAQGMELRGKDLIYLSEFYDCSDAEIEDGALKSRKRDLYLVQKNDGDNTVESFQWRIISEDNQLDVYSGEKKLCTLTGIKDTVTFYYCRKDSEIYLLTDGAISDQGDMEMIEMSDIAVLRAKKAEVLRLNAKGLALQEYMGEV